MSRDSRADTLKRPTHLLECTFLQLLWALLQVELMWGCSEAALCTRLGWGVWTLDGGGLCGWSEGVCSFGSVLMCADAVWQVCGLAKWVRLRLDRGVDLVWQVGGNCPWLLCWCRWGFWWVLGLSSSWLLPATSEICRSVMPGKSGPLCLAYSWYCR